MANDLVLDADLTSEVCAGVGKPLSVFTDPSTGNTAVCGMADSQ
ncbi:MAG: hypothetical protein U0904_02615 [Candidatus Nanopelagicales bacterium]|nr:hypothetical protein [Candidatus Nanopelagicales bacterium]